MNILPLLVALAAADSIPSAPAVPLSQPFEVAASAAAVAVHRQPGNPLLSLRLALLADDPPGYAGAGHLLQHLIYRGLEERARRVGGRVNLQRTSDAIVYTVTGPAEELPYLAELLRGALQPPRISNEAVLIASRELAEERLAEWEIAASHLRASLRARLFPGDLSPAGTEASAARLTAPTLAAVWTHLYRPERVSITAVGDVHSAEISAAFAELPEAASPARLLASRDTAAIDPLAPAEATRAWIGRAYLANDLDPVSLSVVARVVGDELRSRLPNAEVETEHWWTHHGQALAIIISTQGPAAAAAQRSIGTVLSGLQENLTAARLRETAKAIRRDMLFYARTPDRMAEVLGQFSDRAGDAEAAQMFYAELEAVQEARVKRTLATLVSRTPIRVDLAPQQLRPRR